MLAVHALRTGTGGGRWASGKVRLRCHAHEPEGCSWAVSCQHSVPLLSDMRQTSLVGAPIA